MLQFLALLIGVGVLGAALVGDRALSYAHADRVLGQGRGVAIQAGQRASDAIAGQRITIEAKAANAASNPRLVAAISGGVDVRTLRDLLDNESWWDRWRRDFPVQALISRKLREPLYARGDLADLDLVAATKPLRTGTGRSLLVKGRRSAYLLGVAPVESAGNDAPWLILARPFKGELFQAVAARAGGSILLTHGTHVLDTAGPGDGAFWSDVLGREQAGESGGFIAADRTWVAAATPIDSKLWLWTRADSNFQDGPARATVARDRTVLWSSAGVGMVAVAVHALRRHRRRAPTSAGAAAAGTPVALLERVGSVPRLAARPAEASGPINSTGAPGLTRIGRPAAAGRYQLLERIGQGGMADVFAAVTFGAQGFRRNFVIKRMRPELAGNAEAVGRFIDEANLGSNLVHPNIVSIFDFGKAGSGYYLAQEYVPGRNLGQVVRRLLDDRRQVLTGPLILWITNQVLHALEYAHGKRDNQGHPMGIIHRDITPENVMVSEVGEVKLVDFGVVKTDHGRLTQTERGQVKGNVRFMAPEQARGQAIDGRADLYSLGLVMFYCLTGRTLFEGGTSYEILVHAASGPLEEERALIAALPSPCDQIVARALAMSPAQRYQNAAEFRAAIAPYLQPIGDTIEAMLRDLFGTDLAAEHLRMNAAVPAAGQEPGQVEEIEIEPLSRINSAS